MGDVVEILGDFERDGVVCLRGAFGSDDLDRFETAIESVLASPSPLALRASDPTDGLFFEDFCNASRLPEMANAAFESAAGGLAHRLMGARTTRWYHDHVLVKEAGTSQSTPWHQDQPYYNVDGRVNVSLWIPVDPVPSESALQCVAGTHLGPWYLPRTFKTGAANWFPEGSLAELPDPAEISRLGEVMVWDLEPGDAIAFNMATVHGAAGSSELRRVLSLRFLGDDMVFARRPWRTSPPFDGLDMVDGAPVEGELFPVLVTSSTP
jgi:ectoine hydroxylase-related dioxygenase (phytanoyl-CoA dioxygenase family)